MEKVRIILSGGGTRCAYQLSFLEELMNNYKNDAKDGIIDKIYGTSFGALVGFFVCLGRYEDLYNFFFKFG